MMVTVVQAKVASMIAIGAGSFIVGVAPLCFVSRVRYLQQKLLLSCTLCFGGGVLFATAILHMLPEIRESMPEYAELLFSCGFLLLYFIDEFVHYFWNIDDQSATYLNNCKPADWNAASQVERCRSHSHQVGPAVVNRTTTRSVSIFDVNPKQPYRTNLIGNEANNSTSRTSTYGAVQYGPTAPNFTNEGTFLCHGNHSEPCANSNANLMGLLLALTVHAVLEGLAVGLQKAVSEVFLLVGAVASHKFVVGFCLGLELAGANSSVVRLVLAIFVFSAGSALGIGIGMLTIRMNNKWTKIVAPILQGLAGGTLLYGTVSEILPRERARWHRSERRCAGILQFSSVILGFLLIYLLNNYVGS